jgi:hypothetical protein
MNQLLNHRRRIDRAYRLAVSLLAARERAAAERHASAGPGGTVDGAAGGAAARQSAAVNLAALHREMADELKEVRERLLAKHRDDERAYAREGEECADGGNHGGASDEGAGDRTPPEPPSRYEVREYHGMSIVIDTHTGLEADAETAWKVRMSQKQDWGPRG